VDEVTENAWTAEKAKKMGKADFRYAVTDFYLTNPIARASQLMGELSANAKERASAALAAE
jgi:NADH-quinone oxidoreductase subunit G